MPVYLYWGEEDYNLEYAVKEFRKKVLDPSFAVLNYRILNEPELKDLLESVQALPMMFGNLLIEVKANNIFLRGNRKVSTSDALMQKLCDTLENLNPKIYLLFVCNIERESGKKFDSTIKLSKTIQKIGEIIEFPSFKSWNEDKILEWINKTASQKSVKITTNAAKHLIANIGTELRKIDAELEKAKTAVYPETTIDLSDVEEVVSSNENVFLFADYWILGKKTEAIKELHKLFEKNHPLKIIATLQTVTRKTLKIKIESKVKNSFELSQMLNTPKFVVEKEILKLKNISLDRLFFLREKLDDIEYKIKSGKIEPELGLEMLTVY
jgi:DNA polymerase-3 subunit delta